MFPNRPIIWYVLFVLALFCIDFLIFGTRRGVLGELVYAMVVGACALGGLYIGEKIRQKWFSLCSKNQ